MPRLRPRRRGGRSVAPAPSVPPATGPPSGAVSCITADGKLGIRNPTTGQCVPIDVGGGVQAGVSGVSTGIGNITTAWVRELLKGLVPILKVGAGGVGLLVSGLALVYVAGRNVGPKAAPVSRAVRTVTKVPGRAPERKIAAAKRTAARSDLARARVSTEHQKRPEGVVKIASRRVGRERLREEGAMRGASVRRTPDRGATMAEGLGSPRRRAPKTHART